MEDGLGSQLFNKKLDALEFAPTAKLLLVYRTMMRFQRTPCGYRSNCQLLTPSYNREDDRVVEKRRRSGVY